MKFIKLLIISTLFVAAEKNIIIDLTAQRFHAIENNKTVLQGDVTTGKVGYLTPTGTFPILSKKRMHISNRYPIVDKELNIRGGAKMPYALRLTNSGIFIHAGEMPGRPDSHGCIRVEYGNAMRLYKWADLSTKVRIKGKTPLKDSVNQMRLSMKNSNTKKPTNPTPQTLSKSINWIERSLDYYDNL